MKSYPNDTPVYSHNPYQDTRFPLLVLEVKHKACIPFNEGFRHLHWHEELQFVYIKKGVVHFKLWEQEFELSKGSCMFINRNVLHYIAEKEDCSYHSFLIPKKFLGFFKGSIMEETVLKIVENPLISGKCFCIEKKEDQTVLRTLRDLDALYFQEKKPPYWEYRMSLKMNELWVETAIALEDTENALIPAGERDHERIQELLDFVHRNYGNKITLKDISASAHVSQTETLRCFKKYTGYSPYQYLQNYRLQAAAALLETTEDSVTEIAMKTCFPSASAFIAAFRRAYGMTPGRYREEKQNKS